MNSIANQIFGNHLNSDRITNDRLKTFTSEAIAALGLDNTGNRYTAIIAELTTANNNLETDVADVNVTAVQREAATMGLDTSMDGFIKYMGDNQGAIARAMGGKNTLAYHEFYPDGQTQYSKATKTSINTLFTQVIAATNNHSGALGTTMTAELLALQPDYNTALTLQGSKVGLITGQRTTREQHRIDLETSLNKAFHTVGLLYPGNETKAAQYFHFEKLYVVTHHQHLKVQGTIPAGGQLTAVTHAFTDTDKIYIKSVSLVSNIHAVIVDNPAVIPAGIGAIIKADHGHHYTHDQLGSHTGTYLILINTDPLNAAPYLVDVTI